MMKITTCLQVIVFCLLLSNVIGLDVVNCTYAPNIGKPIEMTVENECAYVISTMQCDTINTHTHTHSRYNIKIRTCNADSCSGTGGGDERKYIDCPAHVDHKTNATVVVDQDVHFLVFINTATGSEAREVWAPIPETVSFCN